MKTKTKNLKAMKHQQVSEKLNFLGEEIYVGIDVHKKHWNVFIMSSHKEHKGFSQPPQANVLGNYLRLNFPGATYRSVYEAGYCGFWPHRELLEQGINNIVVNPADVPGMDKEKKHKSDKVDCRKLCRGLRAGDLEGIYVPDIMQLEDRELLRLRMKLVRDVRRFKCRIKGMLNFYGINCPSSGWTTKFLKWLNELQLSTPSGTFALRTLVHELEHIIEIKKKLGRQLRICIVNNHRYTDRIKLLCSVPGVGLITAMTFLMEVSDISRFKGVDQLCNYIGLVPSLHSSADKVHVGNLSSRKNKHIMAVLIESAWTAVGRDPALLQTYHRLCNRMKGQEAIIRIARKLVARMRYVLVHHTNYQLRIAA